MKSALDDMFAEAAAEKDEGKVKLETADGVVDGKLAMASSGIKVRPPIDVGVVVVLVKTGSYKPPPASSAQMCMGCFWDMEASMVGQSGAASWTLAYQKIRFAHDDDPGMSDVTADR
jgi:hypothetical protein